MFSFQLPFKKDFNYALVSVCFGTDLISLVGLELKNWGKVLIQELILQRQHLFVLIS